ncbi:Protein lunapark [Ceratobasidium theobromae]|uniref:Endoplasmic reticulum junction formation protein lunapark n=1 Tax=Ceratobasidium theobromae TaxID=1582974 RepID=A0A5N5QRS0_9AGAM|nr:Protein lunapark [Ceratobasidium theobromae]
MGLFSWLSSKNAPTDTEVLEALAESIRARDEHLSEIRRREARTSLLFTLYSIAAWALYLALWFYSLLPPLEGHQALNWTVPKSVEKIVHVAPGVAGPIIIYQTRRLVQSWYKRQQTIEENQLKKLRAEQKKKLEEIKTKHNFDKTRELLEMYGEIPRKEDPNVSIRQRAITMNPTTPRTPRSHGQKPQQQSDRSPNLTHLSPTPPRPIQPPQKGWLDKVADRVLGEEDSTVGLAQSRYALICERCFSHNGLVRESEWETTQYICPKCGHMNFSPAAKRAGPRSPPRLMVPVTGYSGPYTALSPSPMPMTAVSQMSHSSLSMNAILPSPAPTTAIPPSPVPTTSDAPSQDHPSQDQPHEEKMEVDASSS